MKGGARGRRALATACMTRAPEIGREIAGYAVEICNRLTKKHAF
jgi:hypothetical protein